MLAIYALTETPSMLLWMGPAYALFMAFVGLMGSYYGELYPVRIRTTGSGFCFNVGRGVSAFAHRWFSAVLRRPFPCRR
ncbi:hypothetical protein [Breoghania sp.]|uniref:hypothetical protein n=1 Tax=Breoghania sp. TaxID=2065378 RepID=UPI002628C769|nr:hypothetical protein [Breoghania sp.]MDJ0932478.1 hypothetical protein [Breoghania sp.]